MSADPNPVVASETDSAGEPMAAPDAAWRSMDCVGCGQRPDDLTPLDAIALTAALRRRCASLLAQPDATLRHRGSKPGSWSALEPAAHVSAVIAAANHRLRGLLGEEAPSGAPGSTVAALQENLARLIATICAATAHDWYRSRPDNGATAGEVVWLALHEATHHVEDAELVLDAASAPKLTLL
jgi:hypothetical protein